MTTRNIKSRQGFTVIEMIMYGAMLMGFLGVLTRIFISLLDNQLETAAETAVLQDSRYIFSRLAYDMGRTQTVIMPSLIGEPSDTLQISVDGQIYTYRVNNGVLELTTPLGVDRLHSIDTVVPAMTFVRFGEGTDTPSVAMTLALQSVVERVSGTESRNYQFLFALR